MGNWVQGLYIIIALIASAIAAVLSGYVWRYRAMSGAKWFSLLMLGTAQSALAYALRLMATDLSSKLFWAKVMQLGIVIVPTVWLAFTLEYTGRGKILTPRNVILLIIEPLVTLLLAWTADRHRLYWGGVAMRTYEPFPTLEITRGLWLQIHAFYSLLLVCLGTALVVQVAVRSHRVYRRQGIAILLGASLLLAGNAIGVLPMRSLLSEALPPLAYTLTGLTSAWGLFRCRLFDLVPVARDAVIDSMDDGMIVLDERNRIVDLNVAAQTKVGLSGDRAIGQPAEYVIPWCDWIECAQVEPATRIEVNSSQDGIRRQYDLSVSSLADRSGHPVGRLLVLRDVTEQVRAEEERNELIAELQQALAQVRTLSGLLPICASCKKIRDEQGHWHQIEAYIREHSEAQFSHGICPECARELYPDFCEATEWDDMIASHHTLCEK